MSHDKKLATDANKGTRILARSFFKELRDNGYSHSQILALSTELIDLVTREVRAEDAVNEATPPAPPAEAGNAGWRQAL